MSRKYIFEDLIKNRKDLFDKYIITQLDNGDIQLIRGEYIYINKLKNLLKGMNPSFNNLTQDSKNKNRINSYKSLYNDKYKYPDYNYINNTTKFKVICDTHGVFETSHDRFSKGYDCPMCNPKNKKLSKDKLLPRLRRDRRDLKDYNIVIDDNKKVTLKDSTYTYIMNYQNLISGYSPGVINMSSESRFLYYNGLNTKDHSFIRELSNGYLEYNCNTHGVYKIHKSNLKKGDNCPKCSRVLSKGQEELFNYIKNIYKGNIILNYRTTNPIKEIDIYLPDLKLGFEYNGNYYHSTNMMVNKNYHINKTNFFKDLDISIIHIWEDLWHSKNIIYKSIISNKLKGITNKIYARECTIKEVNNIDSNNFLNINHLQGSINASYRYGLYYKDNLVQIMTFGKDRYNNSNGFELYRLATKLNILIVGGASKLFKHFIKEVNPKNIISYGNRDWVTGNVYLILGFIEEPNKTIGYYYVKNQKRFSRQQFTRSILKNKYGYTNMDITETQIMSHMGFMKIYNTGNKKFRWTRNN